MDSDKSQSTKYDYEFRLISEMNQSECINQVTKSVTLFWKLWDCFSLEDGCGA